MKNKFLKFFVFSLVLSLVVISCKKDDDNEDDNSSTTTNKVTLTIDNGSEIVYTNITASSTGGKIIIGANNTEGDIQIIINNTSIGEGEFGATEFGISHGNNGQAVFASATNVTSRVITITEHNTSTKHIKGTFTLSYNDNVNAGSHSASGSFDVKYIVL